MIKNVKHVLIFAFTILVFSAPVKAFEFIKFHNNPLPLTYSLGYSQQLQAHIYKEGAKYKGILTAKRIDESYYSIVSMESNTGIEWNINKEILNIGKDVDGRVFIDNNNDKRIIFAKMDSSDFYRIYAINCDQDLNCDQNPYLILDNDPLDPSESHGVFGPHVMYLNKKYYLFYGTWGNRGFLTKLAFSDHFGNWQKCGIEISSNADSPFVYVKDNNIYLFVHNETGIRALKTNTPISCDSIWENLGYVITRNESYDKNMVIFPSIVEIENNNLALYYSGKGQDNVWRLNMAIEKSLPTSTITPTSTSTPSPTPTYTLTPTPQKNPIIIIPGMMSTWNKDAILHKKFVSQSEWKLAPFIKEYDGFINTLKALNYVENKDYFIFSYDWRKSIDNISEDLNNFIENKLPNEKHFSIVGHSFGGLVARIYQQKFKIDNLKKIITIGSPLKGAPQAYKAISAGEIDQDNSLIWLAQKMILQLYRDQLKTDKHIINENFQSIKDLLPVFDYLRNQYGEVIDASKLSNRNDFLLLYENCLKDIYPIFTTLSGNKIETIAGYTIEDQNILDKLLGYYIDGRPKNKYFDVGDGLVLTKSSSIGNNNIFFNYNHGEIIYKKNAIKAILNSLNVPYTDTNIHEGTSTVISPSLILMIRSPAEIEIKRDDKIYKENEGIIFIENALTGEYDLFVHGKERGKYEILIGEIGEYSNSWNTINGEITSIIPKLETDRYKISFNSEEPDDYFVDLDEPTKLIDELIVYLKQNFNRNKKIINDLGRLKYYIARKKYEDAAKLINLIDKNLVKNKEYNALEKLEHIYVRFITKPSKKHALVNKKLDSIKKEFLKKQNKLLKSKIHNTKLIVLELINKKIRIIEDNIRNVNYSYVEILLVSISNLLKIL